jgi:phosphoglycolate phosphatase
MLVYKLIIFDFDGTLADSRDIVVECLTKTFEHFGDPVPDPERIAATIGMKLEDAALQLVPGLTPEQAAERADAYRNVFQLEGIARIKPMDGAEPVLEKLAAGGVRMALLSNRKDEVLKACVKQLGWERFFSFVGGMLDDGVTKPASTFRRDMLASFTDVSGADVLMVGDSTADMMYANNMGVDSCLALFGYGRSAQARIESPDYEIESLGELESIVL